MKKPWAKLLAVVAAFVLLMWFMAWHYDDCDGHPNAQRCQPDPEIGLPH